MALFNERLPDHLGTKLVIAFHHNKLVVKCSEDQAEKGARFAEEVMLALASSRLVGPDLLARASPPALTEATPKVRSGPSALPQP